MARILKLLVGAAILAAIVFGGYSWLQGRESATGGFQTVQVTKGSITDKAVAVGRIEPRVRFHVKSKISGIVRRCLVQVGDRVGPGDPLFEIAPDPTPTELVEAESRLDAAQSAFHRAETNWNRTSELARQGVVPHDKLDNDKESFEQARIELARVSDNLKLIREGRLEGRGHQMESIIRSTASGIVLERKVDPGDPVVPLTSFQEGTELATIADMRDLMFKGTVDEIDVGKLALGAVARLKVGALPGAVVTGKLNRIAPQAKEENGARLFEVEIELDPASNVVLRAGYSANADLILQEKTDILLVPERLVLFENDGAKTFVEIPGVEPDAEPRKVEIVTGLSDGLNIEVKSGLAEGDKVVQRPPREILG
jgi:HlyD family secretion protein